MFDLLFAKERVRRFCPPSVAHCMLLLALSAALCGCGLAQSAYLSSKVAKEAERIPETGSRADIMRAAAEHPDAALLSPAFYREATPDDVRRVLKYVDPTKLKHSEVEIRRSSGGGSGGGGGNGTGSGGGKSSKGGGGWNDAGYGMVLAAVAKGTLLPDYEIKSYTTNPAPTALRHSRHPEVIAMLGDAGCKMTGWIDYYISRHASYTVNPETLALLLSYEPDPVQSASILDDLVNGDESRFPPEALRVFLDKSQRGRKALKEDDSYHVYAAKAVESGSLEKLRIVLEGGASPDQPWLSESPILLAYKAGRQDMVEALLAAGAKDEKPAPEPAPEPACAP